MGSLSYFWGFFLSCLGETAVRDFELPWDEFCRCLCAAEVPCRQQRSSSGSGPGRCQPSVVPGRLLCLALPALLSPAVRRALTPHGPSGLRLPPELLHELFPSRKGSGTILSHCLSHAVAPVGPYLGKGCLPAFWVSFCSNEFVRVSFFCI